MRRERHAMNLSNPTPSERSVCSVLKQVFGGYALVSASWLKACIGGNRESRPDFPTSPRELNRVLLRMQKWNLVRRVGSSDRGAWYVLAEVWDQLDANIRNEFRLTDWTGRGDKETILMVELGPGALPDSLRSRVWTETPARFSRGEGMEERPASQGLPLGPLPEVLTPDQFRQIVSRDTRFIKFDFTSNPDRHWKGSRGGQGSNPLPARS